MLVSQSSKLFSYANAFFCSNKFAYMLTTWVKTLYSSSRGPFYGPVTLVNVITKALANTHLLIIVYFSLGATLINILLTLISTAGMLITFFLCEQLCIVCHLLYFRFNPICSNLCLFCAKLEDKYFTLRLEVTKIFIYRCIFAGAQKPVYTFCFVKKKKNKTKKKQKNAQQQLQYIYLATFVALQVLKVWDA